MPTDPSERESIAAVMAGQPYLTHFGFGTFCDPFGVRYPKAFQESRDQMLADKSIEEFKTACAWLGHIERTQRPNRHLASYGAKHYAERWGQVNKMSPYVSNGMLLAACYHLGIAVRQIGTTASAYVGLSSRAVKAVERAVYIKLNATHHGEQQ